MKPQTFTFDDETLHKINLMIEACFNIGGTKINYENGKSVSLAEVTVDVKRAFEAQIKDLPTEKKENVNGNN